MNAWAEVFNNKAWCYNLSRVLPMLSAHKHMITELMATVEIPIGNRMDFREIIVDKGIKLSR